MLSVLNVAYPFAAVGPNAVGGAEQVLTAIDAALVAHGHRSLVIACEGSSTSGTLLPLPAGLSPDEQARTHALLRRRIEDVWDDVDLIHLHGIDFPAYLPRAGKPVLVTLHLPPDWYPQEIFAPARADTWLNCVSEDQHQRCPPSSALLKPIRNGVPVRQLAVASHAKRGFALMLGRICPEKGQHLGLEAAHQAGVSALLGGVAFGYPAHIDYFESRIKPLLDRHRRHVG
ncbi:MAG: glycosyltransferase, partial [Rhodospirillales bacterium]|nr:glycosyltransferase [Acetobacter sp.]